MRKLVVDAEGKLTIPPYIVAKRSLRSGDELTLVEADEGLLSYQNGPDGTLVEQSERGRTAPG